MNRSVIFKRISSILDDIQRLNSELYAMNSTDIQRYPVNYAVLCRDAALRSEAITCRMRHLIYASTSTKKSEYLVSAADIQGVDIQQRGSIFEITLPSLLPERKHWQSTEYLLDPLTAALRRYAESHPMPRFHYCTVCFSLIYAKNLPDRRIRDYDNLELKQYLDVAASFVMTDDTGLLCDTDCTTELGETDCTRIAIMDQDRFPEWLKDRRSATDPP